MTLQRGLNGVLRMKTRMALALSTTNPISTTTPSADGWSILIIVVVLTLNRNVVAVTAMIHAVIPMAGVVAVAEVAAGTIIDATITGTAMMIVAAVAVITVTIDAGLVAVIIMVAVVEEETGTATMIIIAVIEIDVMVEAVETTGTVMKIEEEDTVKKK